MPLLCHALVGYATEGLVLDRSGLGLAQSGLRFSYFLEIDLQSRPVLSGPGPMNTPNAVNSSAPPHVNCGSVDHLTLNCQVGSPFAQDTNGVNYVNNFNQRPTNDPYSKTYNLGWGNHPNFSYRPSPNPLNLPQMNARPPPGFQRPPFPQQAPPKSNSEAMMERMLLA